MKSVLITGCSEGGIGGALAEAFQRTGRYHVFATARNTSKISTALKEANNTTLLELDVTSSESIKQATIAVSAATDGKLDVLINNSGLGLVGPPVVDVEIERIKALFDVNFFGVVATTQAFMPLVVKAKGVVVNNSSIVAASYFLYNGIYACSKSALTTFSETLRLESAALGIRVITLMTGAVSTKLFQNQEAVEKTAIPDNSMYTPIKEELEKVPAKIAAVKSTPAEQMARQVVQAVEGGVSGKVWLGELSAMVRVVTWLLPAWAWDQMNWMQYPFQDKLRKAVELSRQSIGLKY